MVNENALSVVSHLPCDAVLILVALEEFVRLRIILPKLLDDVLAHVAVIFLHLGRNLQVLLRGNIDHLATLSHKVEHELRDVTTGDRDVLDGAADDITFRARNNVGDTISRIDDSSSECAVGNAVGRPGRGQSKDSLDGNIETLDVEGLEEDLRSLFTVLRRVKRGLGLYRVGD